METIQKKSASFKGIKSAGWVIVICFIVAVLIFHFVLGNPSNFMNNDPNNHPLPGTSSVLSIKVDSSFRLFKLSC